MGAPLVRPPFDGRAALHLAAATLLALAVAADPLWIHPFIQLAEATSLTRLMPDQSVHGSMRSLDPTEAAMMQLVVWLPAAMLFIAAALLLARRPAMTAALWRWAAALSAALILTVPPVLAVDQMRHGISEVLVGVLVAESLALAAPAVLLWRARLPTSSWRRWLITVALCAALAGGALLGLLAREAALGPPARMRVEGVVTVDGAPASGGRLTLVGRSAPEGGASRYEVTIDAEGRYAVEVPGGIYVVKAVELPLSVERSFGGDRAKYDHLGSYNTTADWRFAHEGKVVVNVGLARNRY